ncbi:PD-(D/E)XK nuclease family protein [Flagellimonas algicola]|uniref:PD-(D/E)XK nuclease family protein n=1 Tax=Flagellimonas algicola TaxID=2583815 RepID=A0ABY2WL04_9FLAO|nr:PD-(D/E)XK nuclease family protein [Allomuricauda algicola]TMU55221.1 PD-(D/E)XK nuclease family protein [Allomuricauda algicola]
MQQSFLEYVLHDLQQKGVDITECSYILPSKRSGTFLKKHMAQIIGKSIFSPTVLSIEDFVTQISGLSQASNVDLILELYSVYKKTEIKQHDDFDTFLKWGQTLLQDFNEIDRYLIPPNDILNYLSAIKELNHWSMQKDKSDLVRNYLALWNNLSAIYKAFTKTLIDQQKGYQGLMYRWAAKRTDSGDSIFQEKPIVFIGFNALNTAEAFIIQHYLNNPLNHMYWDIDAYFLDSSIHDAGLFIRNYKQAWPYYQRNNLEGVHHNFLTPKDISITGVPKSISQAQYAGHLLAKIQDASPEGIQDTALVLADESLLIPMLQALPSSISKVNITMGFPLNKTVLYSFFLSFLDLQLAKSEKGWFFEDVLTFFSNPFCLSLSSSEKVDALSLIAKDIKQHNRLYLNHQYLEKYSAQSELMDLLFSSDSPTPLDWISRCLQLIQKLKTIGQQQKNAMELEYLYRFHKLFNQLKQQIESVNFIKHLKSVKSFFKQLAALETTDFIGEPLSGLQIMGMLESRNLDFETVIITSVNEGILPAGKSGNSFFPFDVKREFGLPTYKEKDAIYTYHFYRLIQRAKNVYLIYNTEPDVLEGGEKSRLISQLLTDKNVSRYISHSIASPELKIDASPSLQIEKSNLLAEDIRAFASKGFSPTAITNYIRNPMDFYKKNILKIYDTEEVEQSIAANTFGTIIHDSLEVLYSPLINTALEKVDLESLKTQIPKVVSSQFTTTLPGVDISKGRYLLVYHVVLKYLQNFVDMEIAQLQKHEVKILALEEKYESFLQIPGLDFPIKLKGTLDRVDQVDGTIRIVDYKTGRVEPSHVKIKDWDTLITNYDKSKAFQLLCYAYLYHSKHGTETLIAGLYSFKNLKHGFLPFSGSSTLINAEVLATFENYLQQIILEICDPKIAFTEKQP